MVDVLRGGTKVAEGTISVGEDAPGIFVRCAVNPAPAGYWLLVNDGGGTSVLDAADASGCTARVIPISDPSVKAAFLTLYATGLDSASQTGTASGRIVKPDGSTLTLPLQYLGPSGYPGIQQANLAIPVDLLGSFRVSLCATWSCSNEVAVQTR